MSLNTSDIKRTAIKIDDIIDNPDNNRGPNRFKLLADRLRLKLYWEVQSGKDYDLVNLNDLKYHKAQRGHCLMNTSGLFKKPAVVLTEY